MTKKKQPSSSPYSFLFPRHVVSILANEVAELLVDRLPHMIYRPRKRKSLSSNKKIEGAVFLDTSAIIDGRIFEIIDLGLLSGVVVVLESILLELKHIADSQDAVKRERGRSGLELLEKLKKSRNVKLLTLSEDVYQTNKTEVDEKLIEAAKSKKGRIITCDYNLEKKAHIQSVIAVNINALANALKVQAVPGEALHVKVLHQGKDVTQGVGYLDDGTMIVIEGASSDIDKTINVVVVRILQTSAGRILFSKKI